MQRPSDFVHIRRSATLHESTDYYKFRVVTGSTKRQGDDLVDAAEITDASSETDTAASDMTSLAVNSAFFYRFKSHSELPYGLGAPRISASRRTRPFSTGDYEEHRNVTVSGFSLNNRGTWEFKVDVSYGDDEYNSYVIRRRFTDFKILHEGLQLLDTYSTLPPLPHHGIFSMVQLLLSPDHMLKSRVAKLQQLLEIANYHPIFGSAAAFQEFIGINPSMERGYVSLSVYEAPTTNRSANSFHTLRSRSSSRMTPKSLLADDNTW